VRRLFQLATLLLTLVIFITPVSEYFDRWDAPGLANDTEFAVFAVVLLLCLLLVVCKLLAMFRNRMETVQILLPPLDPPLLTLPSSGFPLQPVIPPISPPLRI
jgi:hypothetical protein